ncbi:MAG: AAA family ATPase, partial [Gammaproteobacteria bacterium]|nr:AAA family ATPase [Gammaproteobacteria bacterium]
RMAIAGKNEDLQRIVVLNPKGGCGKTTIATNIASYIALRGPMPVLLDCDPQGGAMSWLEKRSRLRAPVHGIAAYRKPLNMTRTWQLRVPSQSRHVVVDTPAGLEGPQIHDLVYDATNVLIPVMPSPIDIRYAARFIAELLLVAQLDRGSVRVGIVASRTRQNSRALKQLMRFLTSLRIPVVALLRDSQNFVRAADEGIGVCDMPLYKAKEDIVAMADVVAWLDRTAPRQELPVLMPADEPARRGDTLPLL